MKQWVYGYDLKTKQQLSQWKSFLTVTQKMC